MSNPNGKCAGTQTPCMDITADTQLCTPLGNRVASGRSQDADLAPHGTVLQGSAACDTCGQASGRTLACLAWGRARGRCGWGSCCRGCRLCSRLASAALPLHGRSGGQRGGGARLGWSSRPLPQIHPVQILQRGQLREHAGAIVTPQRQRVPLCMTPLRGFLAAPCRCTLRAPSFGTDGAAGGWLGSTPSRNCRAGSSASTCAVAWCREHDSSTDKNTVLRMGTWHAHAKAGRCLSERQCKRQVSCDLQLRQPRLSASRAEHVHCRDPVAGKEIYLPWSAQKKIGLFQRAQYMTPQQHRASHQHARHAQRATTEVLRLRGNLHSIAVHWSNLFYHGRQGTPQLYRVLSPAG